MMNYHYENLSEGTLRTILVACVVGILLLGINLLFAWDELGDYVIALDLLDIPLFGARLGVVLLIVFVAFNAFRAFSAWKDLRQRIDAGMSKLPPQEKVSAEEIWNPEWDRVHGARLPENPNAEIFVTEENTGQLLIVMGVVSLFALGCLALAYSILTGSRRLSIIDVSFSLLLAGGAALFGWVAVTLFRRIRSGKQVIAFEEQRVSINGATFAWSDIGYVHKHDAGLDVYYRDMFTSATKHASVGLSVTNYQTISRRLNREDNREGGSISQRLGNLA